QGQMLGSLRRLSARARPSGSSGERYEPPAPTDKLDPLTLTEQALAERLGQVPGDRPVWRALLTCLEGPGPVACRELAWRAGIDPDLPWAEAAVDRRRLLLAGLLDLASRIRRRQYEPAALLRPDGSWVGAAAIGLASTAAAEGLEAVSFASILALGDGAYRAAEHTAELAELRNALRNQLERALKRARRRLAARLQDQERADAAEQQRLFGELLLAHLDRVPRGAASVELPNLYDPAQRPVRIALEPTLSAADNARRYFERARRLERTRIEAERQRRAAAAEIARLEGMLAAVQDARDESDLRALAVELAQSGLLPETAAASLPATDPHPARKGRRRRRAAAARGGPLHFISRDGWSLWVGRNDRENEQLTFGLASPDDWWFHVKGESGAHVIARAPGGRGGEPPPRTVTDAAMLAAHFSRARHGRNVPVDYTERRRVRKLPGAAPGTVRYEGERTVFVTPAPDLLPERVEPDGHEPS
ncbi:MAG TPA: NFACT RNA binding domain-containing protein, partial [Bacillota bacterium]